MPPRIPEPRATQHENVYVTIVVVIALNHVQTGPVSPRRPACSVRSSNPRERRLRNKRSWLVG